jgi:hypothetical protein
MVFTIKVLAKPGTPTKRECPPENILNKIKTTGWHSPDFWLAWNYNMKSKLLVSKDPICFQKEGYSALDYLEKDTWF